MDLTNKFTRVAVPVTAAISINKSGDFDDLQVSFDGNTLTYYCHDEGKAEGYDFEMVKQGNEFVVTRDNTSYPVPGSMVLWLYSSGYANWQVAEKELGGYPKTEKEVRIPADKIEMGLKKMIEEDERTLDLNLGD